MSSIPVLLSFLILFAAQVDQRAPLESYSTVSGKPLSSYHYEARNPRRDYQHLYRFIKKEYPHIPDSDVKAISENLVKYGNKHQLDPQLIAALISKESSFNKRAVSSTGAKGLGQIKDFNYKSLKIKDPFNIKQNIRGTSQYLKSLMKQWRKENNSAKLALASYYKGPNAVQAMKGKLDDDSRSYVNGVLEQYKKIRQSR